jgi:uncharacterized protein involved in outer membrane biogenesis
MTKNAKSLVVIVWGRRLLYLLGGVLAAGALLVGAVLAFFDDEDYRWLLSAGAEHLIDARLEINGTFSLSIGRNLQLHAGDIRLIADDGSYLFEASTVRLNQRLGSYLLTGTLWINQLVLSDAQLYIKESGDRDFRLEDLTLPPVVIQEVSVSNAHLAYEEHDTGEKNEIALLELEIDDVNDSGPVGIRSQGVVNGRPFEVNGRLDPIADLLDTQAPYGLSLEMTSGSATLQASGSIADPVRGEGLDLEIVFNDSALSGTVGLFDRSAPELGALSLHARITGDYEAPALQSIDLHMSRGERVDLRISGAVDNLLTGRGMDLNVKGTTYDPAVLSWHLFDEREKITFFAVSGRVQEERGNFIARDVVASSRSKEGLELELTGTTIIPTPRNPQPKHQPAMTLTARAPTTAALNLVEFPGLPEFGEVKGSALYRPHLDGQSYTDIQLEAGDPSRVRVHMRGAIDRVPYGYNAALSGIDLRIGLDAVDSEVLGRAVERELPALGAVRLAMLVTGDTGNLLIDDIRLETGQADQPAIRVSGHMRTQLRQHTSTLSGTFDAAVSDLVAAFWRLPSGYLGRIEGSFEFSDVDGSWGLDRFDVASRETDLYMLRFAGALEDVVKRDQAEINVLAEVPDPAAFGRALDVKLAGVSPYRLEGVLKFDNRKLSYRGSTSIGQTRSRTELTGSIENDRPFLEGSLVVPVLYLADFGLLHKPATTTDAEAIREAGKEKQRRPHLFSRDPLRLGLLDLLDLDLGISIDNIDSRGESAAQKIKGRLQLRDRVLNLSPLHLVAEGGPTDIELEIDARDVPAFALSMSADDQRLGPWLAQVQETVPVEGYSNYSIQLRGRGATAHEVASSLDGHVSLAVENAKIPRRYIEYLSVDVFGWAAGQLDENERYANLDCILGDFDIQTGMVSSTLLAAEGPRLAIEGNLKLDLGAETIDAVFLPKQKRKLFKSISPVKLKGDMRDPDVTAIPAKEAARNIGALVLVPYVAIPVAILGKLWQSVDDGDEQGGGCASLNREKAEAASKAAETDTKKTEDWAWYE